MIITRDGEEVVGEEEDGSEEDFEAVAVIGGNLFQGAGPSRILPREETFFLRMRKEEEGEEEFGSIIFIKDSCNNITDLEEEGEKKKNIKNTTEDLDQDLDLEEGKRKDILRLHPPAEVHPQILTVLLPRKRRRRRIRSIKRRRRVRPRRRKKRKIPVLGVNLMERKKCRIGEWIC